MASSIQIDQLLTRTDDASPRILLHNISWELYEKLRDEEANWEIRMAYDNGSLELLSPSQSHGEMESRFPAFVAELADVLSIDFKLVGSTTWRNATASKAKEADACFSLSNYHLVRHKKIDLEVDPPPDLVIEVEVSPSALESLSLYESIGVPEIWRFDGQNLRIHTRQADGRYIEVDQSVAFSVLHRNEIVTWMRKAEAIDNDLIWKREVREWARVELLPRLA